MSAAPPSSARNALAGTQGFTLLELMVALTITMIIGISAYTMLQTVIQAQEKAKQHSQHMAQLEKALWIITQDLEQAFPQTMDTTSDSYVMSFIRKGWDTPLTQTHSGTLRVSYRKEDDRLLRDYQAMDSGAAPSRPQPLLQGLNGFSVRLLPAGAVEIRFNSPLYGTIERIIELPAP